MGRPKLTERERRIRTLRREEIRRLQRWTKHALHMHGLGYSMRGIAGVLGLTEDDVRELLKDDL